METSSEDTEIIVTWDIWEKSILTFSVGRVSWKSDDIVGRQRSYDKICGYLSK